MRYPKSLNLLCEIAKEQNIDPALCLSGTGLTLPDLAAEQPVTTTEQEAKAIENFLRLSATEVGLGRQIGLRMHVHMFGIWGFAILTSPTLRAAIDTAIKFAQLSFVIADIKLSEADERARLVFGMAQLPRNIHGFILERHATVTTTFIQEILQLSDHSDFILETQNHQHNYCRQLSDAMTMPVVGGAAEFALTFPRHWLDKPLPKSDPLTLQYCLKQCEALLKQTNNEAAPWSAKVKRLLMDHIGDEIKIETLAHKLNLTERTLRRRLTNEGTGFRAIYRDVRLSIAYELLETTQLNTETVSWRVGYAESASFIRAFTQKYGQKPSEVRGKNR